jgi:hypothetical protein
MTCYSEDSMQKLAVTEERNCAISLVQNEVLGGKIDIVVKTCLMRAKVCLWKWPESNRNMSCTRISANSQTMSKLTKISLDDSCDFL